MSSFHLSGRQKLINTFRGAGSKATVDHTSNSELDESQHDGFESYFDDATPDLISSIKASMPGADLAKEEAPDNRDATVVQEILEKATREAWEKAGKPAFIPDGERSRYLKLPPTMSNVGSDDESNLFPPPLQPRSARTLTASEDEGESLFDALQSTEAIAILQEQQAAAAAAQSAVFEAAEKEKKSSEVTFGVIRRKLSSTFSKDNPEHPKSSDINSPSPSRSVTAFFRKASSNKLINRGGDGLESISENDAISARASTVSSEVSMRRAEQVASSTPRDSGYHTGAIASPATSSGVFPRKPFLSVNTTEANKIATTSLSNSPALTSGRSGLSATAGNRFDQSFGHAPDIRGHAPGASKYVKNTKLSSPRVTHSPSSVSLTPTKTKMEKFTNKDPLVRNIERGILREEWGVNTTSQLTSAYKKRQRVPPPATPGGSNRGHSNSYASTAETTSSTSLQRRLPSDSTSTAATTALPFRGAGHGRDPATSMDDLVKESVHKRQESNDSAESTGSVIRAPTGPRNLFAIAAPTAYTGFYNDSTTSSSTLRASGDTNQPDATPATPETPGTGDSFRIRRKEVGSGSSRESPSAAIISPNQSLGRGTYTVHNDVFDEYPTASAHSSLGRAVGRSFTEPISAGTTTQSFNNMVESPFATSFRSDINDSSRASPINNLCKHTVEGGTKAIAAAPQTYQGAIAQKNGPTGNKGTPCKRLKHEEDAQEERRLKTLSKVDFVEYMVQKIRKRTNTEIIPYNKSDDFPKHPNHHRKFHSRNLWCSQCVGLCPLCKVPCCAMKGATLGSKPRTGTPRERITALGLQKEIETWVTVGKDDTTFMECTDCHRMVCPDCTGICPIFPCGDRLCESCNPDSRWEPCEFHTREEIRLAKLRKPEME